MNDNFNSKMECKGEQRIAKRKGGEVKILLIENDDVKRKQVRREGNKYGIWKE